VIVVILLPLRTREIIQKLERSFAERGDECLEPDLDFQSGSRGVAELYCQSC